MQGHLNVLPSVVNIGDDAVAQQRGQQDACGDAQLVQRGDGAPALRTGYLGQKHRWRATSNAYPHAWLNEIEFTFV